MNSKYSVSKEEFFNELSKLLSVEDIRIATILSEISNAISSARIKKKMNQKELSSFLNMSQSMVSKLESGDYNFTIESMVNVLTALDIDFEVLIGNTATEYFQDNEPDGQGWHVARNKEPFVFPMQKQLAIKGA